MTANLKHFHRDERDAGIEILATKYPACFFVQPQMRQPLKRTILSDLIKDTPPAEQELLGVSLKWYEDHFGYHYSLKAGAKRIDLNGRDAGVVTPHEAKAAQDYIHSRQKELRERNAMKVSAVKPPVVTKPAIVASASAAAATPPATPSEDDLMTELRTLFDAVLALRDQPEVLRRPLAIAGLRAVVAEIEKRIAALQDLPATNS
jgi:sRNA-binding protein